MTISPAAADYIRASAAEQGRPEGVRLRILAGGCSGLEYKLDLLEPGESAPARPTARCRRTASRC